MTHYLKASDEATLRQALIAAGILIEAEESDQIAEGFTLDVIGVIGVITKPVEGTEEIITVEGWHANLAGDLSDEQQVILASLILPMPANPYRVFAGA